jgi:hypothetical protein
MSGNGDAAWVAAAGAAVEAVAGAAEAAELRDRWRAFEARPLPLVTLYGPYDSGKSSLLKRLLVADGTRVPGWLTVSARRETYELNEIDSGGITFRDCPGVSAGAERHELIARDALATTDALLLILPPQLMTSGREHLIDVVSGGFFGGGRRAAFPPDGLLLVIAQADAIGADPEDDPDGFRADCERKRAELHRQLAPGQAQAAATGSPTLSWSSTWTGLHGGVPPIYLVAADPYGMTARTRQPSPDDYADSAGWDGVRALRAALRALPGCGPDLRAAAELRFWSLAGLQALLLAESELAQVTLALDEARRAGEHVGGLETQLDAVCQAAEMDLRQVILNELRSIAESAPSADLIAVQAEAGQRLLTTCESWEMRWRVQLGQLAREGAAELRARAARPGTAALTTYLDQLVAAAARPADGGGHAKFAVNLASRAGGWVPKAATSVFQHTTGQTVDEAKATLARYRDNKDLVNLSGYYDTNGAYYTVSQLAQLQHHVYEVEIAQVVPALVQLAGLLWTSVGERQQALADQARHAELSDSIERTAGQISERILGQGWTATVADVRAQFHAQLPAETLLAGMRAHHDQLTAAAGRLRELLDER